MPRAGHGLPSPPRKAAPPCTGGGRSPVFPIGPGPRHHTLGDSGRGHRLAVVMVRDFAEVAACACRLRSSGTLLLEPPLRRRTSTCHALEVEAEPSGKGAPTHRVLWSAGRLTATFGSVILVSLSKRQLVFEKEEAVRDREISVLAVHGASLPLGSFSAGVRPPR
ncbi:unnamed protein product [Triticum turgidum subsp. durum]|uniref:Uncharacterized protein n=1 Tax=Triticum turgidum subsp. durum TaxID=4567 RepID=A0A9R0RX60_TRITD|nr:unnamed protein product [Triticum turgidum subsp. durum]